MLSLEQRLLSALRAAAPIPATSLRRLSLKQRLLSALRAAAPIPATSLRRLSLSTDAAAAAATPPSGFLANDYLVASCGLTQAQARKASKYLSRLSSHVKPDAVRAFLAGIGLAEADVAAAIVSYPPLLSCKVDETLTPRIAQLREMGLSPSQISRLVTIAPEVLFSPVKISRLAFYLSFLGSFDRVHSALNRSSYLLRADLETVVRPNIAFLRQCGLTDYDIGKHFLMRSRILLTEPQRVKEIAARAEELGVSRSSLMFKHALLILYGLNAEALKAKLSFLKKVIGCSEAELGYAVRKMPAILLYSESKIGRNVEFLKVEVGLEHSYILQRPAMFGYSIERRLMPRHCILRILKAKGFLSKDIDFFSTICTTEDIFLEKFLLPYYKSVPGLMEAYASACTGHIVTEL
jgi:mTERF domain-containing protein